MVILDTDIISAVMRRERAVIAWLDRQPELSIWTTAINFFEIRYGLAVMPLGRRRASDETTFNDILRAELADRILPFDTHAAEQAALLMARRRRTGRIGDARDTMIGGIALAQRATLATRNVRHFDDLSVPVVNPWQT
jgi:predicted nucleic acid-binding protein